jgi:hypothetical protein
VVVKGGRQLLVFNGRQSMTRQAWQLATPAEQHRIPGLSMRKVVSLFR